MTVKTKSLLVGICLLAGATFAGQTVESFTKQSLGLDLATVPFGMTARTDYTHADAPVSPPPLTGTNVIWTTNAASGLYRRQFPNRILRFGFRNGRLDVVRISISTFDGGDVVNAFRDDEKISERRRNELRQILDEINKFRSNPEFNSKRKGAGFDIRYGAMCAPTPESLFILEAEITKVLTQSNAATIYDPNPDHLWNRLFNAFYHQRILFQDTQTPEWTGPDVVDPPFGRHPPFILDGHSYQECNALLDEFLQNGVNLIRAPVRRAAFQHDLWAVFDTLAGVGESPMVGAALGTVQPLTDTQKQHRMILEQKLAKAIHALALSRTEIQNLPDTYRLAVASGAFSSQIDPKQFAFLPDDLFATNGEWVELASNYPLSHTRVVGGRSNFRAFIKVPTNSAGTNILADYLRWSRQLAGDAYDNHTSPHPTLRLFPIGTQFLLLREMICIDENGEMAPTHIVETVQVRASYKTPFKVHLFAREADLNRQALFAGRQGGLLPVMADSPQVMFYDSLGFLRVDDLAHGPPFTTFPYNCAGCHQPRDSGVFSFNSNVSAFVPRRSVSIEPLINWKKENGKADLLSSLAK